MNPNNKRLADNLELAAKIVRKKLSFKALSLDSGKTYDYEASSIQEWRISDLYYVEIYLESSPIEKE